MSRIVRIVFVLALVALASQAWAEEAAKPAATEAFWSEVARSVGAAAGIAVLALATWVGTWVRSKWGVEVSILKESRARSMAAEVAAWVEEWAVRQLNATGVKPASEEKLEKGAVRLAGRLGCPKDVAEQLIESVLPSLALGAAGALRAVRSRLEQHSQPTPTQEATSSPSSPA